MKLFEVIGIVGMTVSALIFVGLLTFICLYYGNTQFSEKIDNTNNKALIRLREIIFKPEEDE